MKHLKRAGALALALVLTLTCLSGCKTSSASTGSFTVPESIDLATVTDPCLATSGLTGDTVVATAGEVEITAAQLLYWIAYSADNLLSYYSMYGLTELPWDAEADGATLADSIKKNSLDTAALYALLPHMGKAEGLEVSEEFTTTFADSLVQMSETLGGDELMDHYLWQYPLTRSLYTHLCESEEINSMLLDVHFGEGTVGYPTDEQVLSFLEDDQQCYFFKHILLLVEETSDGSGDSSESSSSSATVADNSAEQKALAEELLAQLRASDDPLTLFDQLMNEYSEDGGLTSYPDGYLGTASDSAIVGNTMVSVVEDVCLSMDDYEISDVLENTVGSYHGYHIVLKLPLAESVSADDYRQDYISVQMDQLQKQWLADNPVVTNENFDKINPSDFYAALTVLRQAVSDEMEALDAENSSSSTSASGSAAPDASGSASSSQG